MATRGSVFTAIIVGAFALAGVIALSTCASQGRSGAGSASKTGASTDGSNPVSPAAGEQAAKNPVSATSPTLDERLTPIIAELAGKFEQHEALSATLKTELGSGAGGPGNTQGKGIYEFKKQDGKRLIRVWLSNSLRVSNGEKVYSTAEVVDDVYDGEYLYKHLQQYRLKQVTKRAYTPSSILQIGGREVFRQLTEGYSLKLSGEESVNDSPAYVIEATPIGGNWKAKHWFDKATGVRVKLLETNEKGETTVDIAVSEIKLNPEFSEENFKPKIPAGFKLIDETVPAGPQP